MVGMLALVSCKDDDSGETEAEITSLVCSSGYASGTLVAGESFEGTLNVPYLGGNGLAYEGGEIFTSTDVTGLTATLVGGTLNDGSGTLQFTLEGTPDLAGTAAITINFDDFNCTVTITVSEASSDEDN